ncbi:peptidoglycan DD-metalloendopeptidase family protein [Actinoplanes friuliensis]|uniref:Putative M23-family peptidase n=1 Tax=Actinoplanes friuliensis DSM 7358 TaxID=1246995 RepID=U5WAS9_9ACTN|nr:peptidoglycan DD-metalloendopeptidase family protein [Actinoplanes friuliensis]AGZ46328.1 putative M23-family peptidase [Actinoplanes friuliensis DSM 7358]
MKKRRHQRTALALLATGGTLLLDPAAASAAPSVKVAGTGTVVTGGTALNARSGPSASSTRTGTVRNGTTVSIVCRVAGQFISGTVTNTGYWDRLSDNSFVSDAYVRRGDFAIPKCTTAAPLPAVAGAWMLPVTAGLISGFRTGPRPAHDGVDLAATRNTPIRAASSGTVIRVVCNVSKGSCDVDGNGSLSGCGWYVEVLHAGGIVTRYCHLVRRPEVSVGETVARGAVLGHVGTSGSSSGPHLHFEVHNGSPATRANAVSPITFMRARGLVIS